MSAWLVKSEPDVYAWADLVRDGRTVWDGIRNYQARNNLRAMKKGEAVLFYHSGDERSIVGLAEVARAAYADPGAKGGDWSCVDLVPVRALGRPVELARIKATEALAAMALLRQGRLSVVPVTRAELAAVLKMGGR